MFRTHDHRGSCRTGFSAALFVACLMSHGCATQASLTGPRVVSTENSPVAEEVAPIDAWRFAEAYVASHSGCDTLVGSGTSMMPLYRDRTVLVVQLMGMSELRRGMTVVFVGDQGRPVAHTLIERTPRGWMARGIGNPEPDRTPVQSGNYLGTVIKAFAPNPRIAAAAYPPPALSAAGQNRPLAVDSDQATRFATGDQ